jgi:uncharacterized protein related to proFAR isomerase
MEYMYGDIELIIKQNNILKEQNRLLTYENKVFKNRMSCIQYDIDRIISINNIRNIEHQHINIAYGISEMLESFHRKHLNETYCISTETFQSFKNKHTKNNISFLDFPTDINNLLESNRKLHVELNAVNAKYNITDMLQSLKNTFKG